MSLWPGLPVSRGAVRSAGSHVRPTDPGLRDGRVQRGSPPMSRPPSCAQCRGRGAKLVPRQPPRRGSRPPGASAPRWTWPPSPAAWATALSGPCRTEARASPARQRHVARQEQSAPDERCPARGISRQASPAGPGARGPAMDLMVAAAGCHSGARDFKHSRDCRPPGAWDHCEVSSARSMGPSFCQ